MRGIGVALIVRTSAVARSRLRCSLWRTPKRCSSSITMSPRSWNCTFEDKMACVPITMSVAPESRRARVPFFASALWNLLMASMRTGVPSNRARNVS